MKRFIAMIFIAAAILGMRTQQIIKEAGATPAQPVKSTSLIAEILAPLDGSVVGTTVTITAAGHSANAPIAKTEFFIDGVLYKTITNEAANR